MDAIHPGASRCTDPERLDGPPTHHLERGGVLFFRTSPFPLPTGADLEFLLSQRLAPWGHKNISWNPQTTKVAGYANQGGDQVERLQATLGDFSRTVTDWLRDTFPHYHRHAELDRVSYRTEQEEVRKLRLTSRNDLLHVDAFPGRPSQGRRILRVFANINPSEARVWITTAAFAQLLRQYGEDAGLPGKHKTGLIERLKGRLSRLLSPGRPQRSDYDAFMLRLHDFLKRNHSFQKGCPKVEWEFPPGSVWAAFTDTCSHAVLRGRYALEHSYFIAPAGLSLPQESPPMLLERRCGNRAGRRALAA